MSNYILHQPTAEVLGLQLKTNNGSADLLTRAATTTWRRIHRTKVTGSAAYIYDVVMEAYKAGYQDGMRRPIKERVLIKHMKEDEDDN